MKNNFIYSTFLSFFLILGCNQNDGLCEYYEYKFQATVIALQSYKGNNNEPLFHVVMKFNNSSLSEKEQYLETLRGFIPDTAFLRRNKISIGNVYTGIVNEIKSGDCKKMYVSYDQQLKFE